MSDSRTVQQSPACLSEKPQRVSFDRKLDVSPPTTVQLSKWGAALVVPGVQSRGSGPLPSALALHLPCQSAS